MDRKRRIEKVLTVSGVLLTVGVVYTLLCVYTPFRVPCVFRLVTDLKCPGCGVTQMLLSLLRLDFKQAFLHNRVLIFMLPAGVSLTTEYIYRYVKTGTKMLTKTSRMAVCLMIAVLVIFGAVRNIFGW